MFTPFVFLQWPEGFSSLKLQQFKAVIGLNSFSAILGGIADPVEPFNLKLPAQGTLLPLFGGIRDGFGELANLFDHPDEGQIDAFQGVHYGLSIPVRRLSAGGRSV